MSFRRCTFVRVSLPVVNSDPTKRVNFAGTASQLQCRCVVIFRGRRRLAGRLLLRFLRTDTYGAAPLAGGCLCVACLRCSRRRLRHRWPRLSCAAGGAQCPSGRNLCRSLARGHRGFRARVPPVSERQWCRRCEATWPAISCCHSLLSYRLEHESLIRQQGGSGCARRRAR